MRRRLHISSRLDKETKQGLCSQYKLFLGLPMILYKYLVPLSELSAPIYPVYKRVCLHLNTYHTHYLSLHCISTTITHLYTIRPPSPISTPINIMPSTAFSDAEEFGNGPVFFAHCIACVLTICCYVVSVVTFANSQVRLHSEFGVPVDYNLTWEFVFMSTMISSPLLYVVILTLLSFIFLLAKGIYYYFKNQKVRRE